MTKRNKLLSKAEYAARIGVNRSQVTRYCAKGMPTHAGMIDPEEADWWREQNLDPTKPKSKVTPPQQRKAAIEKGAAEVEKAARPASPPPAPTVPADGEAATPASGVMVRFPDGTEMDLGQIGDLPTVTRIDKFWAGELKRRDAMVHDREHLPRADVEAASTAAVLALKTSLMGLPRRLAGKLEGKGLAEREQIIRDEIKIRLEAAARKMAGVAAGDEVVEGDPDGAEDDDAEGG